MLIHALRVNHVTARPAGYWFMCPQPACDGTFPCLDSSATFFLTSLRLAASHAGGTSGLLNQGDKVVLVR
jgi:hypothetical protein